MLLKTLLLGAIATTAVASTAMADGHEGKRARDGEVKIIYWQAPSILNPYLSGGTKDLESSSLVIEPMGRYDNNGDIVPYLAVETPSKRFFPLQTSFPPHSPGGGGWDLPSFDA